MYHKIILSNKNRWNPDIYNEIMATGNHCVKRNKQETKNANVLFLVLKNLMDVISFGYRLRNIVSMNHSKIYSFSLLTNEEG